ncbi:MAG TPA: helix-turn-helix domain-containing protein [Gryllotalpicola sp.]
MAHPARALITRDAESAVDTLGSVVRVAILSFLRRHGPATRGDIAAELAIDTQTVQLQLGHLRRVGVVVGEAIRATGADRHRMIYAVDAARAAALLAALSAEVLGA